MVTIQPIEHDGRVVALVAGGRALLGDQLTGRTLTLVRAKCLYALEVQAGERAGPYSDQAATRYAQAALAHRHQVRSAGASAAESRARAPVGERAGMRAGPSQTASTLARAVGEGPVPHPAGPRAS